MSGDIVFKFDTLSFDDKLEILLEDYKRENNIDGEVSIHYTITVDGDDDHFTVDYCVGKLDNINPKETVEKVSELFREVVEITYSIDHSDTPNRGRVVENLNTASEVIEKARHMLQIACDIIEQSKSIVRGVDGRFKEGKVKSKKK